MNSADPLPANPWLHEYYARYGSGVPGDGAPALAFLIGSTQIGGGNNVIFEHARFAQRAGADVTLIPILAPRSPAADWHPALSELKVVPLEEAVERRFDVAIATWWPTVLQLPRLRFRHAAYFIQSIESRFHATGPGNEVASLAEMTYLVRLPAITVALWMQNYLAAEYQAPSFLARNGIDKAIFSAEGPSLAPRDPGRQRVLVEGQMGVRMKGVDRAIDVARRAGADEVWLLTSSELKDYPGCDRVISQIALADTPRVYRSCDILVKLSQVEGMFGPPLEMMHCGGTVVTYDVTGHDEYVEDGRNGLVVPMGDEEAAVGALVRLRDADLLARLQEGAGATAASWPDWESSSREFLRVVSAISRRSPDPTILTKMMMASGAGELHKLVTMRDPSLPPEG